MSARKKFRKLILATFCAAGLLAQEGRAELPAYVVEEDASAEQTSYSNSEEEFNTQEEIAQMSAELAATAYDWEGMEDLSPFAQTAYQQPGRTAPSGSGTRSSASSAGRGSSRYGSTAQSSSVAFNRPTYMIADSPGIGSEKPPGEKPPIANAPGRPAGLNRILDLAFALEHPNLGCSKTNIAENNSPIVQDRVYFNYRHFENASDIGFFPTAVQGGSNALNVDRYILGFEKRIGTQHSVEFRAPMSTQLNSDLAFSITPGGSNLPLNDLNNEFGNLALLVKGNYFRTDTFVFAAGMALTFPTAQDVHIRGTVDHPRILLRDPSGQLPPLPVAYQLDVDATIRNQTYNITPFIGYVKTPTSRIFHQGFFQVDVPLNQSSTLIDLDYAIDAGAVTFDPARSITTDRVQPQTVMRADLGAGYWFINDPGAPYLNQLGFMAEVHYTTTVNNSELFAPSTILPGVGKYTPANLSFCNNANRVDNLNFVAAIPMRLGLTTITNAFIMPMSTGDNRLFDFEYSLFVNRNF